MSGPAAIRILVDADACPVKDEIYRVAFRREVPVQRGQQRPHPRARPSAGRAGGGERRRSTPPTTGSPSRRARATSSITADILLADRCLKAGATVIGPDRQAVHQRLDRQRDRHPRDHGRPARRRRRDRRPGAVRQGRPLALPAGARRSAGAAGAGISRASVFPGLGRGAWGICRDGQFLTSAPPQAHPFRTRGVVTGGLPCPDVRA